MATATVLKFATADGADTALVSLQDLQKQDLITLHDAAIVSWPSGRKGPSTKQVSVVTTGALGGAFWAMFFGLIFFAPLSGLAVGVAAGALGGRFRDYGIDDAFLRRVRGAVTEGTSALFLMTSDALIDRVADSMKQADSEIITPTPSKDQERRSREAFARN
jgi:uncharacterized membrane protein